MKIIRKVIFEDDLEQVGLHPNHTFKFFYNLLSTKKPNDDAPDNEFFRWAVRYYSGLLYFALGDVYHKLITWITQYYPFSLLYQDSLIHAKNKVLRKFVLHLEELAKQSGLPMLICGNNFDGTLFTFESLLYDEPNNRAVKQYEALLQKKFGSVYIRKDSGKKIRIIMPHETLHIGFSI